MHPIPGRLHSEPSQVKFESASKKMLWRGRNQARPVPEAVGHIGRFRGGFDSRAFVWSQFCPELLPCEREMFAVPSGSQMLSFLYVIKPCCWSHPGSRARGSFGEPEILLLTTNEPFRGLTPAFTERLPERPCPHPGCQVPAGKQLSLSRRQL